MAETTQAVPHPATPSIVVRVHPAVAALLDSRARLETFKLVLQVVELMQKHTATFARVGRQLATWADEGRDVRAEFADFAAGLEQLDSQVTLCRIDTIERIEKEKAN